uniref:Uncharacterized protein n=1 Tax=Mus musculus TaxID=10090 RepID=Q3TZB1_MOUSE|nr:unnamed protein product [Mus musculus]
MAGQTPLDLPTWSLDIYLASLSSLGPDAGKCGRALGDLLEQLQGATVDQQSPWLQHWCQARSPIMFHTPRLRRHRVTCCR